MNPDPAALTELLLQLDACAWRLDQDQAVQPQELDRLAAMATEIGPALTPEQLVLLTNRLDHVMESVEGNCARIVAKLGRLGAGRRAIRGYVTQNTAPGAS